MRFIVSNNLPARSDNNRHSPLTHAIGFCTFIDAFSTCDIQQRLSILTRITFTSMAGWLRAEIDVTNYRNGKNGDDDDEQFHFGMFQSEMSIAAENLPLPRRDDNQKNVPRRDGI